MSIWWAIFYVVVGGVVLLAAIAGGVLLLAKLIFDETERVRKRQAQWDAKTKQLSAEQEMVEHNTRLPLYKPTDHKARFVSSVELKVGDIVYLRTGQWRVIEKLNTQLGMLIRLQSVTRPNMTSPNRIKQENVYDKVWSLRPLEWKE
jgi:hypothetical protein